MTMPVNADENLQGHIHVKKTKNNRQTAVDPAAMKMQVNTWYECCLDMAEERSCTT